ncbi:anhydro-N-acetylmuramic acid kinase [Crocinitomicaceae bacterium]|nr:anhydro-N-acetylmuramic acid kinase [Crocinitomicaceae bacterium]
MLKKEIIGLMSGTSLDGLDIAHVEFVSVNKKVTYKLMKTSTVGYPKDLLGQLRRINTAEIDEIQMLNKKIGSFFAKQVNLFISEHGISKINIDAIASHGQTILHQPENGFTLQIGCGSTIAFLTGINVINDFRSLDVIAGGQGAPLVPIGDFDLFESKADSFLNIGGFCNISFKKENIIHAFDICPGNLPLNHFAGELGHDYDPMGSLAKNGKVNIDLLKNLNSIEFYNKIGAKSLGTEWLDKNFYTKFKENEKPENILRTICAHISNQIIKCLNEHQLKSVFATGGGVKNNFLMSLIIDGYNGNVVVPKEETIDFKEAIVFAYLGYKYLVNESNTVSSVTGAERSLCAGVFHKPGY